MKDYKIEYMNPFLKIIILTVITIIASIDFKPFIGISLTIMGLLFVGKFSYISCLDILKSTKNFIGLSLGFIIFITLVRKLSGEPLEFLKVFSLGFRIIFLSTYSSIFVKTTDPNDLVKALIKYFRMPINMGYGFLTAYRFLPTFKEEIEVIKYAHLARGLSESKNPLLRAWNSKTYIVPMMANAIRKGIRVSMAMETRGFGKYSTRSNYRELSIKMNDMIMFILIITLIVSISAILYAKNLTDIGFIY